MSSTDCNQLQLESAILGNLKLSIQFHEKNVLICFVVFLVTCLMPRKSPILMGGGTRVGRSIIWIMRHCLNKQLTQCCALLDLEVSLFPFPPKDKFFRQITELWKSKKSQLKMLKNRLIII